MQDERVTSRIARVTPADAMPLLERFHAGAKVDQRQLQAYSHDMQEGRWVLNGAPLVLSDEGRVLDGRLRLLACVQSGSSFDTLIVEGISAASYETIDAVRKRTLADVLAIRNERHGRPLAAALRIIWTYQNGGTPGLGKAPSPTALLAILEEHPSIRDSIMPALAATPIMPHGCGIALHYLMSQSEPQKSDRFFALIGEPVGEGQSSPVVNLRHVLSELRGQGGNRKQTYILAIAIKAWNAFRSGLDIKLLRYSPDREGFPQIGGYEASPGPLFDAGHAMAGLPGGRRWHDGVHARVQMITPEMAEGMLSGKAPNRHVSAGVIHKYARDMAAGQWHLNGQTIKISSTGRLLDGQHRLEAAKKAKRAFPSIVVEGLPDESFSSLDIGRRRSVADILRERGESHTIILASSLRWLWMIRNEVVLAANSSPTNGELLRLLDENPGIRLSLRHVSAIREIMGSGIAAALHFTFAERDPLQADEFFSRLMDGVQLADTSPIYHLRERLIRTRASHRVRLAEAERVALAIKAWNAFRLGRPMQLLVWRNRGPMREALPIPA
jgi:hypothetical protein